MKATAHKSIPVTGISAVLIYLQQTYLQDSLQSGIALIPFLAAFLVFFFDWFIAKFGLSSPQSMRAHTIINNNIAFLKKQIKDLNEINQDTTLLSTHLQQAINAKSELFKPSTKARESKDPVNQTV